MKHSTALPIAWVALRILIVLNWFFGACVLGLLVFTFINETWTMKALDVTGLPNAVEVMWGMRLIAALGIVAIVINYPILKRFLPWSRPSVPAIRSSRRMRTGSTPSHG